VEFRPIERTSDAFQQSVTADQIEAMCQRAFGAGVPVKSVVELDGGMYNNTYRVDVGKDCPVILRVAPEPARQYRIEQSLMRKEYASVPFIAPMMPRMLAADFTHEIIDRDYVFQTMLDGVPGPEGIGQYPRSQWTSFFRQMGEIARSIHAVRGERFGPVTGPAFDTWGEAVIAFFADLATDLDDAGLGSTDVREVAAAADKHRAILDELRRGIQPEPVDEHTTGPHEHVERVGLPAGPVERGHQLGPQPVVPGMRLGEGGQLLGEPRAGAGGQVGLDPVLDGGEPHAV
jgi:aminoglycoside phosphotransferase (APT) family kinase protein